MSVYILVVVVLHVVKHSVVLHVTTQYLPLRKRASLVVYSYVYIGQSGLQVGPQSQSCSTV